jgi:hypothetical protein
VVIEAARESDPQRGRGKGRPKPAEVVLPSGASLVAMTTSPFFVLIPR